MSEICPCSLCQCPDLFEDSGLSCLCGHFVSEHRNVQQVLVRYCPVELPDSAHRQMFSNRTTHCRTRRECGMLVCSRCHKANYLHLPSAPGSARAGVPPPSIEPTPPATQPSIFALRPLAPPLSQQPTLQPWSQPDADANQATHSGSQVNLRRISAAARHQPPASSV